MATIVKHRRGTGEEIAVFTPSTGEFIYNTTDHTIHTGDGTTVGGHKINTAAQVSALLDDVNDDIADITGRENNNNLLINADFSVDQRGEGDQSSQTKAVDFMCDRYRMYTETLTTGRISWYKSRINGEGIYYRTFKVNTAQPGAQIQPFFFTVAKETIEHLRTTGEKLTYSFKFRSNVTGQYSVCVAINSTEGSRRTIFSFDYNTLSTTQDVSFTFDLNEYFFDNDLSFEIQMCMQTTNPSFISDDSNLDGVFALNGGLVRTSDVAWSNVDDSYVAIGQPKLEAGDRATQFIPDDPAVNLLKCQRYYAVMTCYSLRNRITETVSVMSYSLPVTMISTPAVDIDVSLYMSSSAQGTYLQSISNNRELLLTNNTGNDGVWASIGAIVKADAEI